ncbi:MAG TPA: hypothetical protein VHE59_00010 [Mucilaginibacter sp.]|nr:hypothetical protein [Mucilaginibacter sp.]
MYRKLDFQLSVFGLIMAFATVWLIPEMIEPIFWLAIFVFCAYVIAKVCREKYFLNGFVVSLFNCIWITGAQVIFYGSYMANHQSIAKMSQRHPLLPTHPRLEMLILGPLFGIVSGLILGLFSFIASKLVSKKTPA